ncbi:hypothetical protein HY642_01935 [Candidatus Woesearchaeota archaeon]|nr:hypothetical protein [Candidatus Woesearchaeota archaeon]
MGIAKKPEDHLRLVDTGSTPVNTGGSNGVHAGENNGAHHEGNNGVHHAGGNGVNGGNGTVQSDISDLTAILRTRQPVMPLQQYLREIAPNGSGQSTPSADLTKPAASRYTRLSRVGFATFLGCTFLAGIAGCLAYWNKNDIRSDLVSHARTTISGDLMPKAYAFGRKQYKELKSELLEGTTVQEEPTKPEGLAEELLDGPAVTRAYWSGFKSGWDHDMRTPEEIDKWCALAMDSAKQKLKEGRGLNSGDTAILRKLPQYMLADEEFQTLLAQCGLDSLTNELRDPERMIQISDKLRARADEGTIKFGRQDKPGTFSINYNGRKLVFGNYEALGEITFARHASNKEIELLKKNGVSEQDAWKRLIPLCVISPEDREFWKKKGTILDENAKGNYFTGRFYFRCLNAEGFGASVKGEQLFSFDQSNPPINAFIGCSASEKGPYVAHAACKLSVNTTAGRVATVLPEFRGLERIAAGDYHVHDISTDIDTGASKLNVRLNDIRIRLDENTPGLQSLVELSVGGEEMYWRTPDNEKQFVLKGSGFKITRKQVKDLEGRVIGFAYPMEIHDFGANASLYDEDWPGIVMIPLNLLFNGRAYDAYMYNAWFNSGGACIDDLKKNVKRAMQAYREKPELAFAAGAFCYDTHADIAVGIDRVDYDKWVDIYNSYNTKVSDEVDKLRSQVQSKALTEDLAMARLEQSVNAYSAELEQSIEKESVAIGRGDVQFDGRKWSHDIVGDVVQRGLIRGVFSDGSAKDFVRTMAGHAASYFGTPLASYVLFGKGSVAAAEAIVNVCQDIVPSYLDFDKGHKAAADYNAEVNMDELLKQYAPQKADGKQ